MYTLKFAFYPTPRNHNREVVTRRGDSFYITFSGNRIYKYSGVKPEHVLGKVIYTEAKGNDLRQVYVVLKGHTLFSISRKDTDLVSYLLENPEVASVVDSLDTFREFMEL